MRPNLHFEKKKKKKSTGGEWLIKTISQNPHTGGKSHHHHPTSFWLDHHVCIDWWNAWWSETDFCVQMNVICLLWLHLILFHQWMCVTAYFEVFWVFFKIYQSFALFLCFTLWTKCTHGSYSSAFLVDYYCVMPGVAWLGEWQPRALNNRPTVILLCCCWLYQSLKMSDISVLCINPHPHPPT